MEGEHTPQLLRTRILERLNVKNKKTKATVESALTAWIDAKLKLDEASCHLAIARAHVDQMHNEVKTREAHLTFLYSLEQTDSIRAQIVQAEQALAKAKTGYTLYNPLTGYESAEECLQRIETYYDQAAREVTAAQSTFMKCYTRRPQSTNQ